MLYVAQSDPKQAVWFAFPVKSDGTLGPKHLLADATHWTVQPRGNPDGLKVGRQDSELTLLVLEREGRAAHTAKHLPSCALRIASHTAMYATSRRIPSCTVSLKFS